MRNPGFTICNNVTILIYNANVNAAFWNMCNCKWQRVLFEEPGQQIEGNQSVGTQIINKEMQLFEIAKKILKNLQTIYRFLLTNRSILEPERAFSAMGLFASQD